MTDTSKQNVDEIAKTLDVVFPEGADLVRVLADRLTAERDKRDKLRYQRNKARDQRNELMWQMQQQMIADRDRLRRAAEALP